MANAARGQVLTFRIGDRRFALSMEDVSEVVRPPRLTRVPGAPAAMAGLASHRGEVVPVVALAALLGEQTVERDRNRLIVLDRSPRLGLAVDEVTGFAASDGERGGLILTEQGDARIVALDELLEAQFAEVARAARGGARSGPAALATGELARAAPDRSFLEIALAGQRYALPLEQVLEILAAPREIARMPRSDAAMSGVIDLRGSLLPVASTRVLLGLPGAAADKAARVVVTAIGDARVGLLVDAVATVIRSPAGMIGRVPKLLNRGAGEAQIDAMLRDPSGGLVGLLAPERLFRDETVAQILQDGRNAAALVGEVGQERMERMEQFLIFALGGEHYGLPLDAVQEVTNFPERLTAVPNAPGFMAGVMNLRGAVLPVIEQRERFRAGAPNRSSRRRVVVTRMAGLLYGFAVDAVSGIISAPADAIAPTPPIAAERGTLFDRTARIESGGRVILLVNPQALIDQAQAELMQEAVGRPQASRPA